MGQTANDAIRVDGRGATVRILSKGMEVKFSKMSARERGGGGQERHTHLHYKWNTLIYGRKKKRYVHSVFTVLSWSGADGSSQKAHVQSVVKGRAVLMTVDAPKREIQLRKKKT